MRNHLPSTFAWRHVMRHCGPKDCLMIRFKDAVVCCRRHHRPHVEEAEMKFHHVNGSRIFEARVADGEAAAGLPATPAGMSDRRCCMHPPL